MQARSSNHCDDTSDEDHHKSQASRNSPLEPRGAVVLIKDSDDKEHRVEEVGEVVEDSQGDQRDTGPDEQPHGAETRSPPRMGEQEDGRRDVRDEKQETRSRREPSVPFR